jgi:hypothetical protein
MRIVRKILAAPLKLALQIFAFFPKIDKFRLVELIWKIGQELDYAGTYIFLTRLKKGIESARETGEKIYKEYPSDKIAGLMGVIEYDEYNLHAAKEWLEKGRQCLQTNPESLLFLELELSDHLNEYNIEMVITNILSRRDLSMTFTTKVLATQAEIFLRKRKWEEADAILERILQVQDVPGVRWMKWTVAKAKSNDMEAQKQLRLAKTKKQKEVPNIFMALGWYYLGDISKTREYLAKAIQDGLTKIRITQINRDLGALFETDVVGQQQEKIN